ncbi:MAG: YebC/PmpR family DNA-binding transcriptional regulator [Bacteroidota bacterium]|nr:YebC/PmpR family DNA-binding transcriptional regulator [Bacteroidota bacterium]MDP4233951.1 YebC/PmpR family DNA-binding transcriptional regulator [Bacteroidota bacterium]MDP4242798.1 YebC/PmpR family DNA-binding transcriptional regulator [Bacteroidota bacterium]MDP4288512.1 YebC/PmpR family DNA-binding transcriptional regulator [Bacteroidota bacterium]
MSGHSKWSQIKRKKAITDRNRGRLFTRFIREIMIAAREGGGDPTGNPRLRFAIEQARKNSMPADNIKRAIARGAGGEGGAALVEGAYEVYGPAGVAIIVETATDNKNRTIGEIRHVLSKFGGNLGESGSVSWMFTKAGTITVPRTAASEDKLLELALDAGAEDLKTDDPDFFEIRTAPSDFGKVRDALVNANISIEEAKVSMIAENLVPISGADATKLVSLMEALEDNDDVQNVFSNADIDESALAEA